MSQDQLPPLIPSVATQKESKKRKGVELPGKAKLQEIIKKAKAVLEEEEADDEIPYPESEMLDVIVRTRKATQLFLGMLPKLDKADEKRLARAMAPIPEVQPK